MLNVALAKGRLAESCADLFIRCGIRAEVLKEETRKLVLETPDKKFRFFFVKPSDVPTYVEYGIADIGIVGKDTLLEAGADLYEMLDLKFEKCRLCLAGFPDRNSLSAPHLRVATKYVNTAKKLFLSRGEDVEIIKLNGSIELAAHGTFGRHFRHRAVGRHPARQRPRRAGRDLRYLRAAGGKQGQLKDEGGADFAAHLRNEKIHR